MRWCLVCEHVTKPVLCKIMICRWPRWLSTPAGVEKALALIYSYRFAWSILLSCVATSATALPLSASACGAMSVRGTKPYRSLQHMPVCDSASQRQICECELVDKESQVWLNNESYNNHMLLTYSEQRLTRSIKYSASSRVSSDLNSRWLLNVWTYPNSPRTSSYTLRKSEKK